MPLTDPDARDLDLDLDRIAEAATVIDPVFLDSPQYVDAELCDRLGRRVLTKVEILNPLRSFKGRGADFLAAGQPPGSTLVCGSSGGNFGQAVGWAARRHGLGVEVFVPEGTSPVKLRRMTALGARVHPTREEPRAAAEVHAAADPGRVCVVDGRDAAIAEGAGTIGRELLRTGGFEAVVLPVGDGALITGVARWLKAYAPGVRVVGVGAAAGPALVHSWRTGTVTARQPDHTWAAGIAVREPVPESVRRTRALVDAMVLVSDADLRAAMHLAARTLGVLPEPAGAAGLAALLAGVVPGAPDAPVATVLTGGNADPADYAGALREDA